MTTARIELPPKLIPVFTGPAMYRGAYGGRGSGKTANFAKMTAVRGFIEAEAGKSGLILCGREFMNSLDESSLEEVKAAIRAESWLSDYYEIGEKFVRSKNGRIKYVFAGLRHNLDSIKSKARVLLTWVDEAESVSEMAWAKLAPTVMRHGDDTEIWVTWNPESPDSATHRRFRQNMPSDAKIVEINWRDNPWHGARMEQLRLHDLASQPDMYDWIWEGAFLTITDAQVFRGKFEVADFEVTAAFDGPYYGLDWGHAQDPTAAVQCWIRRGTLYIRREAGSKGLDIDRTADFMARRIPGIEKHTIRADNARPESISYVSRNGLPNIVAVEKWPGSVEDGVAHIRSYDRVVIHPDCTATAREFRVYSYKTDRVSGDVLPVFLDRDNHYIDAIRYALGPMIRNASAPRVRTL